MAHRLLPRLHRHVRCSRYPDLLRRLGGRAQFKVTALPPLQMTRGGDRKADLMTNVARFDAIIAPIIRAHLDQWYHLLDFDFAS